jgi:hypothetical protein
VRQLLELLKFHLDRGHRGRGHRCRWPPRRRGSLGRILGGLGDRCVLPGGVLQ